MKNKERMSGVKGNEMKLTISLDIASNKNKKEVF